jgi:hypothetical protein
LPGAPSRETFEAIQNTPSLQEAFALHKKLGGTMDVDKFFPQRKISVPLNIPSN